MKLQRIRLASFRRFRSSLTLDGLTPGINIFAAPNEAGKSTVAEALRAAFLERHRSSSVAHLRPWDDPSASPQVEVDFRWQGQDYRLEKTFLGRKRCHLLIDGRPLDGAQAEDHLAALMGYRYARKGAADHADMGVPGLLWIRQGDAQTLAERVRYAGQTLRDALSDSMGELSATDGDQVLAQVREARQALLHAGTGAPKGEYAAALKQTEALGAEIEQLTRRIADFHEDVDKLEALRRTHELASREQPWRVLAEQLEQARQGLQQAEGLAGERQQWAERLQQAQAQVEAQQLRVDHLQQQQAAVRERQAAAQALQQRAQAAREALARQQRLVDAAAQTHALAQTHWEVAQGQRQRQQAEQRAQQLQQHAATLRDRLARAEAAQNSWRDLQAQAQRDAIAPAALQRLQAAEHALQRAQARLDAATTSVTYDLLPQARIEVDGVVWQGRGEYAVSQPTALHLPGLGELRIVPGGVELETLRAAVSQAQQSWQTQCQALNVADASAAQTRMRLAVQGQAQADAAREVAHSYAPEGVAALQAQCDAAVQQADDARAWLATQAADGQVPMAEVDVAAAEQALQTAKAQWEAATQALQECRLQASVVEAEWRVAQTERERAQALLDAPARAQQEQDALFALADARSELTRVQGQLQTLDAALASMNLEMLRQDVRRLADSEQIQRQQHHARERTMAELGSRLEAMGSAGLDETLADCRLRWQQAQRRAQELAGRAQALDHLLGLLTQARTQRLQKLHAPLQKHLDRYLRILFPGAQVSFDDDLVPGEISREGSRGREIGQWEELSFGAREQVGVLARLAYADLLQEAGRPALVLLDDALVHADAQRLAQMKRVLYDAAQRHQILIFTCHPEDWSDMGVSPRALADG